MKILPVMIMALGALFPAAASAETLDISTLKCSDIIEMSPEDGAMLLAWIDGYLGGRADDTRFDMDRFSSNADAAGVACEADPNAGLLTVLKAAEAGN